MHSISYAIFSVSKSYYKKNVHKSESILQNSNIFPSKNSSKSFSTVIFLHLGFAGSLFGNHLWVTLIFISFLSGLVYNYESTGICFNFPNSCHGCIFALVDLAGSLFAFVQIPIIDQARDTNRYIHG